MKKGKTTVEQGQVTVNSVDLIAWGRKFRVFEIDVQQKYPELMGYGGRDVLISVSDDTPGGSERKHLLPTRITLDVPRGWESIPEHKGRYSMRFGFYRPRKRRKLLWQREDEGNDIETEGEAPA